MSRPKGSKNKATKWREETISAVNLTPLKYMLQILNDPASNAVDKRWAAEKAAPYCHPRLTNIDFRAYAAMTSGQQGSDDAQVVDVSRMDPRARQQLKMLLITAMAQQVAGEDDVIDGEFEERGED